MNKISAIIKISRPTNLIITFAVVIVSAIICSQNFVFTSNLIFGSIASLFVAAAGNIINDIFDIEIDKINRPNRVLVSGALSKQIANILYYVFNLSALIIASQISLTIFAIVFITIIFLFLYSYKFKSFPLIGNFVVAFCTALAFIFGGLLVDNYTLAIIPAVFAFLINLIRELIKDIEDIEGDRDNKISTFPIKYGIPASQKVILIVTLLLIFATIYPFVFHIYKIEYFIVVLFFVNIPLVYFLREILKKEFLNKISSFSNLLKVVMLFGLIAIYLGN